MQSWKRDSCLWAESDIHRLKKKEFRITSTVTQCTDIVHGYGQNPSGNAIRKQFYFYLDSKNYFSLFQILLHTNKKSTIKDSCCKASHCITQEQQRNGTAKCSAEMDLEPWSQHIAPQWLGWQVLPVLPSHCSEQSQGYPRKMQHSNRTGML